MTFNKETRERYLSFGMSPPAGWTGNFRDFAASVTRISTFSPKGRIDSGCVDTEVMRLKRLWSTDARADDGFAPGLSPETLATLDPFDRVQLSHVVTACRASRTLSEAGRTLFAASRARRTSSNDADRRRKYPQRFGLEWSSLGRQ